MINNSSDLLIAIKGGLTPRPLKLLDQRLVRNWPLLWRSRLLWACWISLLLALLGGSIGLLVSTSAQNTLGMSQISLLQSLFQLAGLTVIGILLYMQWRTPIGVFRQLKYLQLALCNCLAVVVLMLQPSAVLLTSTYQASQALTWAEINNDYQYHQQYDFWHCSDKLPDTLSPIQDKKLQQSLLRLGLTTNRDIHIKADSDVIKLNDLALVCEKKQKILDIRDSQGRPSSFMLGDKLKSIYHSHRIWNEFTGAFAESSLFLLMNPALLLVMMIIFWLISQLEIRWQQVRLFTGGRLTSLGWSLPKPNWLIRQDQISLRNQPDLWASRIHLFVYDVLLFGLIGSFVVLLSLYALAFVPDPILAVFTSMFGKDDIVLVILICALPMLLPGLWGLSRRGYPVIVSAPLSTYKIVINYLLITQTITIIFILLAFLSLFIFTYIFTNNFEYNAESIFGLAGVFIFIGIHLSAMVLSLIVIGDTRGIINAIVALIIPFAFLLGIYLFIQSKIFSGYVMSLIIIVIMSIIFMWDKIIVSATTSTIIVAITPAFSLVLVMSTATLLNKNVTNMHFGLLIFLMILASIFFISLFYLLLLQPAIRNLVHCAYQPKPT